jgi:hypothetical protein
MKTRKFSISVFELWLTCAALCYPRFMSAQTIIPFETSTVVRAERPPSNSKSSGSVSNISSAFQGSSPLIQRGPVAVRPSFSYSLISSDGLLTGSGQVKSVLQTFSPGVLVDVGKHWVLDYLLTKSIYSTHLLSDSVDHNASLSFQTSHEDWSFRGSASYGDNTVTSVETGRQTREVTNGTLLGGFIQLSSRLQLELSFTYNQRYADPTTRTATSIPIAWTGADWFQTSAVTWLRYFFSPKLDISAGIQGGRDEVTDNPDMEFIQPQGRIAWRPTNKFTIAVTGGKERRKAIVSGGKSFDNFIYSGSLSYRPRETTKLSASLNKSVSTSYFAIQSTQSTLRAVGIEQRIAQRFFFTADYSNGSTSFVATTRETILPRDDRFTAINARVSTPVLHRGSVSVSYGLSKNRSNLVGLNYTSHQTGFHFNYRF